jgi:hypothetical protein
MLANPARISVTKSETGHARTRSVSTASSMAFQLRNHLDGHVYTGAPSWRIASLHRNWRSSL